MLYIISSAQTENSEKLLFESVQLLYNFILKYWRVVVQVSDSQITKDFTVAQKFSAYSDNCQLHDKSKGSMK